MNEKPKTFDELPIPEHANAKPGEISALAKLWENERKLAEQEVEDLQQRHADLEALTGPEREAAEEELKNIRDRLAHIVGERMSDS